MRPNFTISEFIFSLTAARNGISNELDTPQLVANAEYTLAQAEKIRAALGHNPVIITSGYRSKKLNAATPGSSNTSAHTQALAIDFICPRFGTPFDVCSRLAPLVNELSIDQLIYEYTWTHVGFSAGIPRNQILTCISPGNYVNGIIFK